MVRIELKISYSMHHYKDSYSEAYYFHFIQ